MASFIIEGGHLLQGEITPQGAKNEALQVICATLLTQEAVTIQNIPDIRDVNNLIQLLKDIGVKVTHIAQGSYTFQADALNLNYLESDAFVESCAELRGSVMMIGPLLARMGKAIVAKPGGDKIGRRRLDTHFLGFEKLGAKFNRIDGRNVYEIAVKQLRNLYATRRGLCNRYSKHCDGSSLCQRHYHYLQCCLRAISPTALHAIEQHGCPDQRYWL